MTLTVLSVAYPLARVGPDAVGGAEQVLSCLDQALVHAGHRSIVVACAGSRVAGHLAPVPAVDGILDAAAVGAARARHGATVARVLAACPVDVVHMHGVDFFHYMPAPGVPVLVTLHLPLDWYPASALHPVRPGTWLHGVSAVQHNSVPEAPLLPPVENGIAVGDFATARRKRGFALMLGRICPEKGVHLAIEAAKRADSPLLIAGTVYAYPEHQQYFEREVVPRLDRRRRFIGPVRGARKRRLLAAARCVVIPSLVPETSSLVAREALASGTPVVAFAAGALASTIEHGRTGFLVAGEEELAAAIVAAESIDPQLCRQAARDRFGMEPMLEKYLALYHRLKAWRPLQPEASAA
jgi:glycosyltransferase involved in cell wall biosynthesis